MDSDFRWSPVRSRAAILLADGTTQKSVAEQTGITERTLYNWRQHPAFSAEVDRLTLMMGISSRAERLRIAKRLVSQRVRDDAEIASDKDLLDWLKFAQSETDGIKLDLAALAGLQASLAGEGSDRVPGAAGGAPASGEPGSRGEA